MLRGLAYVHRQALFGVGILSEVFAKGSCAGKVRMEVRGEDKANNGGRGLKPPTTSGQFYGNAGGQFPRPMTTPVPGFQLVNVHGYPARERGGF